MTSSKGKGKTAPKGVKKLSVKKETVKDLAVGPGRGKELGDDQLDAVNGGNLMAPTFRYVTRDKAGCPPRSALAEAACTPSAACIKSTPRVVCGR